ncbi:acyl-CoA dehydrogenase family protein [Paeniglutamicibacter gangotriensis]|uniref:Acyl-CoA dehydrogenase domain-containing protein n=1 Tax=Paeniglutamicibacter gangotriensis Lz1y TaxID=1276920 RepID=M7MZ74_9MICC|nr:acyl-CoA dehydrogenase family protein [Paeniglutamicibacter gangotriensis]EMR00347.1 acyl-CoA dehydrogenase domain-containing protein [Paeniglutamicibacter gangotriensis Lz1y]
MTDFCPSDQYSFARLLTDAERAALLRLRAVLDEHVRPVLSDHWERGEFPEAIIDPLVQLDLMRPAEVLAAGEKVRGLFDGFRNFELARVDASVVTFYNAQSGLFRTAVNLGGSPEQVAELDPLIASYAYKGVFALTEPEHGSDIAGGLDTRATFVPGTDGGHWVINGAKRWIGGAAQADVLAVFARDTADSKVKCFLVPTDAPGLTMSKIERKTSLRIMQNADIELKDVSVPASARLANINSFADVAACLRNMRSDVAWIAAGTAAGAYEAALKYVTERQQFGKPLASFQLIQEKLATMLTNVTASLAMVVSLTQAQDEGIYKDENSAMAKMFTARMLRQTAALAREVCGGNGIVLDYDVARFHADAEAIYSYEGTDEINALILGRAITGIGAFR